MYLSKKASRLLSLIVVICLCGITAMVPTTVAYAANKLSNPGFESGTSGWTVFGGASAVYGGHSGHYSCKHSGLAGIEQNISGLSANTTYEVQAWMKSDGTNAVSIGAKNFGGNQVTNSTTDTEWTKVSVNFTTGPSSTTATIFTYLNSGTAYADDITVYVNTSPTLSLTSPTSGQNVNGFHNITWTAGGNWSDDKITIEFTTDSTITSDTVWYPLGVNIDPDLQSFAWDTRQVTDLMGDDISTCKIRINASSGTPSVTSNSFTVNNYGTGTPTITLTSPSDSATLSGKTNITWTIGGNWGGKSINIYYTPDGTTWNAIASGLSPLSGSYQLDTTKYANGTWSQLVVCDENFAVADLAYNLTISNTTGIILKSPSTNERWSGTEEIMWKTFGDWSGKTVRIDYSPNGGTNWYNIVSGLAPSGGSYSWDTQNATNSYGANCTYRIRVQDNTQTLSDMTGNMTIDNSNINTKSFDQGFTIFPYDRTEASKTIRNEYVSNHGNISAMWEDGSLPWVEALNSSDLADYPQTFQEHWEEVKNLVLGDSTNKFYLAINPGRGGKLAKYWGEYANMDLPSPWDTYTLDNANTITAYTNIIRAAIDYFGTNTVGYVSLGIEVDGMYNNSQGITAWNQYIKLQKKVYETLKSEYPGITFFVTITGPHVHQPKYELLMAGAFNYSDVWAFSTYPYSVEPYTDAYSSVGEKYPSNYYDDFVDMALKYGKLPAVGENGYIHENQDISVWNIHSVSDEALQNYHENRIFKDFNEGNAPFILNWVNIDMDQLWKQEPSGMTKDLYALWRDTGMRSYDDTNGTWTKYSAETTWDQWFSKQKRNTGDTTPPSNVTGFSASDAQTGQVTLSWTKPGDADVVKILRKSGSYSTSNTDGEVIYCGTAETYTDISAPTGVTSYYTAWARDASFNWSNGNATGARDTGYANTDTVSPGDITNFTASDNRYGVKLSWENPSDKDFAYVKIMRKTGSYSTAQNDGTQVYIGTAENYLDTDVSTGTQYYYSAWACDETGANWSSGTSAGARDTGAGGTQLFTDDFESGNLGKWDGSGSTDWIIKYGDYNSGFNSAFANDDSTTIISDNINTTGATKITVRLYYNNHGLASDDNVCLYFYNGTSYVNMANIGGASPDKYQWNYIEVTSTDSSFFRSDFRIKIDASGIPEGKSLYIDDVGVDKF